MFELIALKQIRVLQKFLIHISFEIQDLVTFNVLKMYTYHIGCSCGRNYQT